MFDCLIVLFILTDLIIVTRHRPGFRSNIEHQATLFTTNIISSSSSSSGGGGGSNNNSSGSGSSGSSSRSTAADATAAAAVEAVGAGNDPPYGGVWLVDDNILGGKAVGRACFDHCCRCLRTQGAYLYT